MKSAIVLVVLCAIFTEGQRKAPTILVSILIRNKAHILPYFFSYFERQQYDKKRISLWIRSDHNEDNSLEVIDSWLNSTTRLYHSVDYEFESQPKKRPEEKFVGVWSEERFADVISMKQHTLAKAKQMWADYVLFLDADVLLTNTLTLQYLVSLEKPIVAPLLRSEGMYSNFWGGMSENFYYVRTDEYKEIIHGDKIGEFNVPMVHGAVLIDARLKNFDQLTFQKSALQKRLNGMYKGPDDDIITFAVSANYSGIPMFITNKMNFGFVTVPLEAEDKLEKDHTQLTNILLFVVDELEELKVSSSLAKFVSLPAKDTLGFSKIFMINLERRPERRQKMENNFQLLGLEVEIIPAVDGKSLNDDILAEEWGIEFLSGYLDPYHKRPMTLGEIGCFLSHYLIWKKVVDEKVESVLILEDDIKFEPYFRDSTGAIMQQAKSSGKLWNLIYFGRKKLKDTHEPYVSGTSNLVVADYSYWTLGYVINYEGAKKLIDSEPLKRLLPVDEYLPIMFDRHPNTNYKAEFSNRDLIAWSAAPLLLYPTHYTGDEGYISDTEQSTIVDDAGVEKKGKKGRFDDEFPGDVIMSSMPVVSMGKTEL